MREHMMRDLGEQVQCLRRRRGLSQKALAVQMGASPVTLSHLERGKLHNLHLDHLVALALALEVSTDCLLGMGGETQKERNPA